jgi:hypothetical protein
VCAKCIHKWDFQYNRKSLKIPKGGNQNLHIEEEDNTMAKRKSTKGQTTIYNAYTYSKDRVTRTPLKLGVNSGAPEGKAFPAPPVTPVVLI